MPRIGTPNKAEHDQGFFVKFGDGAMDSKPIAHLFDSVSPMRAIHQPEPR